MVSNCGSDLTSVFRPISFIMVSKCQANVKICQIGTDHPKTQLHFVSDEMVPYHPETFFGKTLSIEVVSVQLLVAHVELHWFSFLSKPVTFICDSTFGDVFDFCFEQTFTVALF